MKKILMIIGNYSPEPSSVANCMQPLIMETAKFFDIDIVTDRKNLNIIPYEKIDGVNVYRIDDHRMINNALINEINKNKSARSLIFMTRIFSFLLKVCYYLRYVVLANEKITAGWSAQEVVDKCIDLNCKKKYDAIISVSNPFKSHYIAEKIVEKIKVKKEDIRWIIFEFDPFFYNAEAKISSIRKIKLFYDESRIFDKCDVIFFTPELYKFYNETLFAKFIKKAIPINFANIAPINCTQEQNAGIEIDYSKINCLFAGAIYKNIRNPEYMMNTFSKLNSKIHLTILTNYNEIKNFKINANLVSDRNISIFPFQKRSVVINLMTKSNILVNIGNTVEFQVPGKIFEYISSGKPIIHFSKIKNDPTIFYLEKYPLVFIVKEYEPITAEIIQNIEHFCFNNKDVNISYDDIKKYYNGFIGCDVANRYIDYLYDILT
mgnify:CR=1 FL=1